MQPPKKNPKKQLEKFSTIFMQIGLVLVLFVVHIFIEHETLQDRAIMSMEYDPVEPDYVPDTMFPVKKEVKVEKKVTPKEVKPEPKVLEKVKKVSDDHKTIETVLPSTEDEMDKVDETLKGFVTDGLEDEPEIEENVPFIALETVPTFPGCKGDNDALRSCFNKKMQQHFAKKFDAKILSELGLPSGKKRVVMQFVINKEGSIIDIIVKAPHPRIKKEAEFVVKKLPKMKPGLQRGRPVGVKYTLPMKVIVE